MRGFILQKYFETLKVSVTETLTTLKKFFLIGLIYYNKHTIIHPYREHMVEDQFRVHTLNFGRTLCYLLNSVLLFL
nr:MAG TPA: hypothetical protein [Caudoviricetes sp.]